MSGTNNATEKTHYRKVFKSDHLGVADLEEFLEEGKDLVFTIKSVKQEYQAKVAGKKIDANIAYFDEDIKPLVLNATNSMTLKRFFKSSFVEDWKDLRISLEIDPNVKMKGSVVGGVRIQNAPPAPKKKPELKPGHLDWDKCVERMINDDKAPEYFEAWFSLSDETKAQMNELKKQ